MVSTGPGGESHQEALPGDRTAHGTGAAPSHHEALGLVTAWQGLEQGQGGSPATQDGS